MSVATILVSSLRSSLVQWLDISTAFMSNRIQDFEFIFSLAKRIKKLTEMNELQMQDAIQSILTDLKFEKSRISQDLKQAKDKELRKYLREMLLQLEQTESLLLETFHAVQSVANKIKAFDDAGICYKDHTPNKATAKVLRESRQGKNLIKFDSAEEMFASLQI